MLTQLNATETWIKVSQNGLFMSVIRLICSGGSRIFQMGGRCFVTNGGAHILFSGKKCMKLKEIGLKWGGHTSFSALL